MKKKIPQTIRILGRYRFSEHDAKFNPRYTGSCFHCGAKGRPLEPVSLLCENCADKILVSRCQRCGNFTNREDATCPCHSRPVDATYEKDGFKQRPLYRDAQGILYTPEGDPWATKGITVRLANAGLIPIYRTHENGLYAEDTPVTDVILGAWW